MMTRARIAMRSTDSSTSHRHTRDIRVRAVLFDLDGVLVDSTAAVERHWRTFAAWYDLNADDLLDQVHGRRSVDTIALLAARLPVSAEAALARYDGLDIDDQRDVEALPGAAALLDALPTEQWAVVTSGSVDVARARLRAAQLPSPPLMITADQVRYGKPHPEPYQRGAALFGVAPQQTLAVEDALAGLTSALTAGCCTLALTTTQPATTLNAAHYLTADLTGLRLTRVRDDLLHLTVTA